MIELIALLSIIVSLFLIAFSLSRLIDAKFNAFYATMLGASGLVLIDIGKYYYIDAERIGWVGDSIYLAVSLLIISSYLVIIFSYRLFISLMSISKQKFSYKKKRGIFVKFIKISLVPISIIFITLEHSSGFSSIFGGVIKGILVALFIYGIIEKDRTAIILSILSILISVDDSSRRAYIAIFLPVLFVLPHIFIARYGRITVGKKLVMGVFLFCVFVLLNALRSNHDYGEGFDPDSQVNNTLHYMTNLSSIDTFYNTAFIVERFPEPWDFYYGETYLSVLVAPIPRNLWEDKPVSLGAPLGLMNRFGYRGKFDNDLWEDANQFSLSPSFVGEAYANFGFTGVFLISALVGFWAALFDKKLIVGGITPRTVPWIVFLSTFILLHRGDFYVSINYQIFMFLGASLFFKFAYSRVLLK